MAEMTAQQEIEIPDGGIAGFMMSDEDFAELARQESERSFGNKGIAGFSDTATKMAALGRYGDDSLIHAQTGEIVVPKPVLDSNPELKQAIFDDMRARGIEDPERYVVGSETNSINPETGLMEFGFFSKVWSGVKKVASETVKTLKKIAPVVLPIAMTIMFPALGAYGAALGSGIGTLLQGGDLKDALKSAAISGLTAGAFQGFSNMGKPGGFTEGFKGAFDNPGARFAQVGNQLKSGFSGQGFSFGQGFIRPDSTTATTTTIESNVPDTDVSGGKPITPEAQAATDARESIAFNQTRPDLVTTNQGMLAGDMPAPVNQSGGSASLNQSGGSASLDQGPGTSKSENFTKKLKGYYEKGKDLLLPSGPSETEIVKAQSEAYKNAFDTSMKTNPGNTKLADELGKQAVARVATGTSLTDYIIPTLAVGAGAGYLGFFDEPEPEPSPLGLESGPTAEEIIAGNPNKYLLSTESLTAQAPTYFSPYTQYSSSSSPVNTSPAPFTTVASRAPAGPFSRPTTLPQVATRPVEMPYSQPTTLPPVAMRPVVTRPVEMGYKPTTLPYPNYPYPTVYVKDGGAIYPRRNGGIMPNEGVPGKDSVRAMLMPGEFVMTTDAVRGAGDGDLNRGINNMYNVMANLERKGRMS